MSDVPNGEVGVHEVGDASHAFTHACVVHVMRLYVCI